jgi:hypothetical protein
MPSMTEEDGRTRMEAFEQRFVEGVRAGWQRWRDLDPSVRYDLGNRSRASIVNDFICKELQRLFADVPGTNQLRVHGIQAFDLGVGIVTRIKKVDDRYRSSNINTRHNERYMLQLSLPDLPPEATRLIVGYQLNELETEIKDIVVTCPDGRRVLWHYSLLGGQMPQELPFPQTPVEPLQPVPMRGRRVRAKNAEKQSNE